MALSCDRSCLLPASLQSTAAASDGPAAVATAAPGAIDAKLSAVQVDLKRLSASKVAWAQASLDERIAVLKEIRGRILDQVHARAGLEHDAQSTAGVPAGGRVCGGCRLCLCRPLT